MPSSRGASLPINYAALANSPYSMHSPLPIGASRPYDRFACRRRCRKGLMLQFRFHPQVPPAKPVFNLFTQSFSA
jgi:hypothetical protein